MLWTLLTDQGHAEDVLLRYRYCYYVLNDPLVGDAEYDSLESYIRDQWCVGAAWDVGSSNAVDYPVWVVEGRRPNEDERAMRDERITARWMREL